LIHYRVKKNPPVGPLLNQTKRIHIPKTNLFKIHFNIILPCILRYPPFSFSD